MINKQAAANAIANLLIERLDWLAVTSVRRGPNSYDIAIVIDGTYTRDGDMALSTEAETVNLWHAILTHAIRTPTCARWRHNPTASSSRTPSPPTRCAAPTPSTSSTGTVALAECWLGQAGLMPRRLAAPAPRSSFAGFRFPPEVIMLAVRWYLRYGLSYRDVEELLAERGIAVDHVTIYRWVQRFTPELIDAARPSRHVAGDRWFVDETYLKVAGQWCACIGRSTSTDRSSMSWPRRSGILRQPAGSSPGP